MIIEDVIDDNQFLSTRPVFVFETAREIEYDGLRDVELQDIPQRLRKQLYDVTSRSLTERSAPASAQVVPDSTALRLAEELSAPAVVFSFTPVVYDLARRGALVHYAVRCGAGCALIGWVYLKKRNGEWEVEVNHVTGMA